MQGWQRFRQWIYGQFNQLLVLSYLARTSFGTRLAHPHARNESEYLARTGTGVGDYVAAPGDAELKAGQHIAVFMCYPQDKGGDDWYIGVVERLCKPHWADVNFPDGKLWCAVKESERGTRWLPIISPASI